MCIRDSVYIARCRGRRGGPIPHGCVALGDELSPGMSEVLLDGVTTDPRAISRQMRGLARPQLVTRTITWLDLVPSRVRNFVERCRRQTSDGWMAAPEADSSSRTCWCREAGVSPSTNGISSILKFMRRPYCARSSWAVSSCSSLASSWSGSGRASS